MAPAGLLEQLVEVLLLRGRDEKGLWEGVLLEGLVHTQYVFLVELAPFLLLPDRRQRRPVEVQRQHPRNCP